jgi:DNA invertase Pin-like site-specific DNA recombinase
MVSAAGIYVRISDDRLGDGAGVARQLQDCRALADRKGWNVAEVYEDNDVSAYRGKPRPAYRQLLADITEHRIDAVVVWHLDRLHRQPRELEQFLDTCDAAGLTHLASVTGDVDLGTDDGRFMARILGAVARKESDDKSRRICRKADELAQAGKVGGGGTRPFGFEQDRRTIRESEAELIREAARRVRAGESLRSVCIDWQSRGVSTPTGKPWAISAFGRMLRSARISGQREHRGEIVGPAEWPAIIRPEDTARLRAGSGSRRSPSRTPRRYLLTRLLRCTRCGAALVSRPRSDGSRRYVCAKGPGFDGCGGLAIMADPLEALIVAAVLYRLDSPELAAALAQIPGDEGEALQDELSADTAQLEELARLYGQREITHPEWLAARKPVEARIQDAKRRLSRMTGTSALDGFVGHADELRDHWRTLSLSRQHAIIQAVVDRIAIGPAVRGRNFFDPDRVTPIWRH